MEQRFRTLFTRRAIFVLASVALPLAAASLPTAKPEDEGFLRYG